MIQHIVRLFYYILEMKHSDSMLKLIVVDCKTIDFINKIAIKIAME